MADAGSTVMVVRFLKGGEDQGRGRNEEEKEVMMACNSEGDNGKSNEREAD
jgi:hypothetical protein